MTYRAASISLSIVLPVIFILGCTSTKYVRIEDPSERIVSGCISMLPPSSGEWYFDKHWTEKLYGADPCEDRLRLASGGGDDIYYIYVTSRMGKWNDKVDDEVMENWVRNYHDRELLKNKDIGAKVINYETGSCNGVKDICAEADYDFISPKRLKFKAGGPTTTFRDRELNPSGEYFYEAVEFYVYEGPYESPGRGKNAFYYEVTYLHVSVNEKKDPELKENAYKVLKNIKLSENWDQEAGF
jgi:hypothetical protein